MITYTELKTSDDILYYYDFPITSDLYSEIKRLEHLIENAQNSIENLNTLPSIELDSIGIRLTSDNDTLVLHLPKDLTILRDYLIESELKGWVTPKNNLDD